MAFELFVAAGSKVRVQPGTVSIDKTGGVTVRSEDLKSVQITKKVAVMLDRATFRIALRKPAEGESSLSMQWQKTGLAARVNLKRALASMGLDPKVACGRFELIRKENLLIVQVGDRVQAAK
jgi:hypothetical protein